MNFHRNPKESKIICRPSFSGLKLRLSSYELRSTKRRRRRFTKRENEEGKIRHLRGDRQNGRVIGLQKMTKTINRALVISDQDETKRKWALKMKFTSNLPKGILFFSMSLQFEFSSQKYPKGLPKFR